MPPEGTLYHRYCWAPAAPEAPNVIVVFAQPEPLATLGAEGATQMIKFDPLVTVLQPTVMEIDPVVAPAGAEVVMLVVEPAVTVALVPLNFTMLLAGNGSKLVPVMVTVVPTAPPVGENPVMVGTGVVHPPY